MGGISRQEHMHKTQHSTHADMSRVSVSFGRCAAKASSLFYGLRDWFTSLLYFTQGAKTGRRKQSRTHSGTESGADGFHPSLSNEICSSAERLDGGGRNPCYLESVSRNDWTFCDGSLLNHCVTLAGS